jgi:hypothetical protein
MAIDSTTEEIIHHAGALLCDRALAGWHVVVVGNTDVRSLRTIGAEAVASISRLEVQTLIVSTEVFSCDRNVRQFALHTARDERIEVLLCGQQSVEGPLEISVVTSSLAARAFKARALAVIGQSRTSVTDTEVFLRLVPGQPVRSDPRVGLQAQAEVRNAHRVGS